MNPKTCCIFLIGEDGAGKDTLGEMIARALAPRQALCLSTTELIWESLRPLRVEKSRANLIAHYEGLALKFGADVLARVMRERIEESPLPFAIYNCIRTEADVDLALSLPNSLVAYITAPEKRCWRAIRERRQKAGEGALTLRRFREQKSAETSRHIREFAERLEHYHFDNSLPLSSGKLQEQIGRFVELAVLPRLHPKARVSRREKLSLARAQA